MLTRRQFGIGVLGLAGTAGLPRLAAAQPAPFGFDAVVKQAQELAQQKYQPPQTGLPKVFADLDADAYQQIRFKPEMALWHGAKLPFEVQFTPRGDGYTRPIDIFTIVDGRPEPVAFSPELFVFPNQDLSRAATPTLGFAGFRLHAPLNIEGYYEEVLAIPGGAGFRAVGRGQVFGITARILGVDTALKDGDEPVAFRQFWLERPKPGTFEASFMAIAESESVVAAAHFLLRPGDATELDVRLRLFPRRSMRKLAIAPMSSMFLHGDVGSSRPFDDWRPEVHDSDGLLIAAGSGEWAWRPLRNPKRLRLSNYQYDAIRGFGLLQRDRDFRNYQDLDALYQQRPSLWVEPLGDWGKGHVELVELPSDAARYNNIIAHWVPDRQVEAGKPLSFDYRLVFGRRFDDKPPTGRTVGTYIGAGPSGSRRFVVDFVGARLSDIPSSKPVAANLTASRGRTTIVGVVKNQVTGGWRVMFDLYPEKEDTVDLRAFLHLGADALTETWTYQWGAS